MPRSRTSRGESLLQAAWVPVYDAHFSEGVRLDVDVQPLAAERTGHRELAAHRAHTTRSRRRLKPKVGRTNQISRWPVYRVMPDFRYAFRALRSTPIVTAVAVLSLAL